MKVITSVGGWPAEIPEQAEAAEAEGFDCITCGELSHDSLLIMTVAATATEQIGLQTSVTIAFPRSPFVLAMEAWDLQHLSRGRFILGLGSQVKGHNERRFGGTWTAPAPRMREYIRMLHAVWDSWQDGKPAEFLGKHYTYTLMTPNFNPGPIPFPRPKVGLAMVGPGMARVAGEVADVVMPHGGIMSDKYMREVLLPAIRAGLVRTGRTWSDLEIAESGYLILGDSDAEIERIKTGPDAPGWSAHESAILRATDELHEDSFIRDETWTALAATWSEEQLLDFVFAVGQYHLVSMALNTLGVQIDPGLKGF